MAVNDYVEEIARPPYVVFTTEAVKDGPESLKQGHYVARDVDYANITPPGSRDLVHIRVDRWFSVEEQNVKSDRTKPEWLASWKKMYEMYKEGKEAPLNGTSVRDWSALSPAQVQNLIAIKIMTVEDLAVVNDEGLRRIGMGGIELKKKARHWLKSVKEHGLDTERMTQLEMENDRLKASLESLQKKFEQLNKEDAPAEESIEIDDILPDEPNKELSLTDQYIAKFGKPPHWKMKDDTIRKKLEE